MKVWICAGEQEGVFGDGKWRLLKAVETTGSLAAAAEALHVSYRKAWGDIRKAERTLGVPLVTRSRGGATGGSTQLTEAGQRWIRSYSAFRKQVEDGMHRAFAECMKGLQSNHGD
jgi:molybdate transport system regulatory protein